MKRISSLMLIFGFALLHAQNVSDYQYIYVPHKLKGFDQNEYNLNSLLKQALEKKKYYVISDEMSKWPLELRQNPCKVLNAELLNDSNMFRNRVKLQFTDCQNKMVLENKGSSLYKEFDLGFQDALKQSLVNVQNSKQNPNLISATSSQPLLEVGQEEKNNQNPSVSTNTDEIRNAEFYTNGILSLQKIHISKDQFILISSASSAPFATFKNTTKSDVYRVTLENGTSTLGYTENGNLVIEIPTSDGNYKKEVFMVKIVKNEF